jgi:hypothetical protein
VSVMPAYPIGLEAVSKTINIDVESLHAPHNAHLTQEVGIAGSVGLRKLSRPSRKLIR